MAGTKTGAMKTKEKLLANDPDYFVKLGVIGGKVSKTGGFYANRQLASEAGRKGGRKSRRSK